MNAEHNLTQLDGGWQPLLSPLEQTKAGVGWNFGIEGWGSSCEIASDDPNFFLYISPSWVKISILKFRFLVRTKVPYTF